MIIGQHSALVCVYKRLAISFTLVLTPPWKNSHPPPQGIVLTVGQGCLGQHEEIAGALTLGREGTSPSAITLQSGPFGCLQIQR